MSKCNFVLFIFIVVVLIQTNSLEKDWTYILQDINSNSTDSNIFEANLRASRVSPGVYGADGYFIIHEEIYDDYMPEAKLFKSASGSSQYSATPFQVAKSTLSKFMNGAYKAFIMNDVKNCSNLPYFEDEWKVPLQPGTYSLKDCIISTENFPTHMQPGFYKVIFIVSREDFRLVIEIIVKVDSISLG